MLIIMNVMAGSQQLQQSLPQTKTEEDGEHSYKQISLQTVFRKPAYLRPSM